MSAAMIPPAKCLKIMGTVVEMVAVLMVDVESSTVDVLGDGTEM